MIDRSSHPSRTTLRRIPLGGIVLLVLAAAFGIEAQAVDCGCETAPLPTVWATLDGKPIAQTDVSPEAVSSIAQLQKQVVDFRKGQLDVLINSRLLDLEAAKQRITADQLLQNEVALKAPQPTDAEAAAFFNANRASIEGQAGRTLTFAEVRDKVRDYLAENKRQERAKAYADQLRTFYGVKKLVDEAPVPKTPADRQKVLATIGSTSIHSEDVENSLRPLIYNTQTQVYRIRQDAIDMVVNDRLLTAEAAKRGITAQALYQTETTAKIPQITDAAIQTFFDKNKARLNGDLAQLKPQIVQYLQEQEQQRLEKGLSDKLRAAAHIEYLLPRPIAPTYAIDLSNRPFIGPATASVTIAAFIDYECKTCAEFHDALLRVVNGSNGKVRLTLLNYPLNQHKDARKAAEAAEAAREQGKFWEYAALLYKNQADLSIAKLKALATAAGLDRTKFDAALDSGRLAALVEQQSRAGDAIGVGATPMIFINGRPTDAYNYTHLKKAVDAAITR
jgi:protein-disulfide isomerase